MPVGQVEELVRRVKSEDFTREYTNGWLALYADRLARRLE